MHVARIFLLMCCVMLPGMQVWCKDYNAQETDSLKQVLQSTISDSLRVDVLCRLSNKYKDADNKLAHTYADQAVALAEQTANTACRAQALRAKSRMLNTTGDYSRSLLYSFKALAYYEQLDDSNGMANLYNNIGIIYNNLLRYDVAEQYLLKALAIAQVLVEVHHRQDDDLLLSSVYGNLGINMMEKTGKLDRGIYYFKKVLEIESRRTDHRIRVLTLMNLGELFYRKKQYKEAREYAMQTFDMIRKHGLSEYYLAAAHQNLGKIVLEQDQLAEAETHLLRARELAGKVGDHRIILTNSQLLSTLYRKKRNADKAVFYLEEYNTLKDSVNNEKIAKQLKDITQGYEIEKRDQKIQLLDKDNELNKTLRNSVIVALLLVLVILMITVMNVRQKKKSNASLIEQKRKIEEQNRQIEEANRLLNSFNRELQQENFYARYEVLKSKVNPHFLFNSLSSLAALIPGQPDKALQFTLKFAQLYRTFIDISNHNIIPLANEIEMVKNYIFLQQIRFHNNLDVNIQVSDDIKGRYIPPFALQIVMENVIRHNAITDDKPLSVSIRIDRSQIIVVNTLQLRKNVSTGTGFGQKNLVDRYRMLGSEIPVFIQTEIAYTSILPVLNKDKESLQTSGTIKYNKMNV